MARSVFAPRPQAEVAPNHERRGSTKVALISGIVRHSGLPGRLSASRLCSGEDNGVKGVRLTKRAAIRRQQQAPSPPAPPVLVELEQGSSPPQFLVTSSQLRRSEAPEHSDSALL